MLTSLLPAFRAYAICAAVLALNLVLLAVGTGLVRTRKRAFSNPEDAKLVGSAVAEAEDPAVLRVQRAHRNALENIVPFYALGLLFVFTGASARSAWAYFGAFTAARLVHSVAYVAGKQPWRTLSFTVGVAVLVGLAVRVIAAAA